MLGTGRATASLGDLERGTAERKDEGEGRLAHLVRRDVGQGPEGVQAGGEETA